MYGGGPLNKKVGDELTKKGVTIFVLYGRYAIPRLIRSNI